MTTRTFFDKGVYKSTLKRFSLGSVLYFIMLFLCTGMLILLAYEPEVGSSSDVLRVHPNVLREDLIYPSMTIAFVVPTVVALLVYRFIHSKKTSIFVHSLPVTRCANYVSTLAGAFTLMALPVIANAAVLSVISLCGYGNYFQPADTVIWALFNILVLFIMFSVSTFAAMCTGNSFALVALNGIFIFAPIIMASITETILLEFLYGYSYERNLLQFMEKTNPAVFLTETADLINRGYGIEIGKTVAFIIFAIALYVLSYFVYKFRHVETSEEVAGFKVLNPIFKYAIAFAGTIAVFSVFTVFLPEKPVLFTFIVILASIIFYFGSEMILKKTVKVWHSYKGYLAFGAVFAAIIMFLGLTSVFGYETYVPEFEDVESAAIYNYYYQDEEPFTINEALNKYIIEVHRDFVNDENRSILNHDTYHDTRIHITYKLKNGKVVTRRYGVDNKTNDAVMNEVYKYQEYKEACEVVFDENIKTVKSISIGGYDIEEADAVLAELFECIKEDFTNLSYAELHFGGKYCYINFIPYENDGYRGTKMSMPAENFENLIYYDIINFYITPYFEKTLGWLDDNGYGNIVASVLSVSDKSVTSINLADMSDVMLSYHYGDTDIDCEITDEAEIEMLRKIFNGYYVEDTPSCGFDDDISITFNDEIWFCPALDGCSMFRVRNTDMYISVTDEERAEFNAIVEKYGMVFPCV